MAKPEHREHGQRETPLQPADRLDPLGVRRTRRSILNITIVERLARSKLLANLLQEELAKILRGCFRSLLFLSRKTRMVNDHRGLLAVPQFQAVVGAVPCVTND